MLNELPHLDEQQDYQAHPSSRAPIGLVVFSPTLQLLYQNRQAKDLSSVIIGEDRTSLSPLTKAFQDMSEDILTGLRHHQASTQLLEKKCVMIIEAFTILFQGIGIRHKQNFSESRIMIRFAIRKDDSNRIGS